MNENPAAFPLAVQDGFYAAHDGMTLRDYFASKALPALLRLRGSAEDAAADAYLYADAMLAARAAGAAPQSDDGWISWSGGPCPVAPETMVEVRFRDGYTTDGRASFWSWYHCPHPTRSSHSSGGHSGSDIIAYRLAGDRA